MKNLLLLFSSVFILFSCGNTTSNSTNATSIDLTGFNVIDLPDGSQEVIRTNSDGKILEEGVIKNGMRNGTWVVYQDRRTMPSSIANFVNDQYSGVYMEFSNTGQLELICRYKANQLNGKFTKIKNTRVLEEGVYIDGKIDGKYIKYYPNKDIVQQETNYKMGQLDGPSKYYNEEGQLIMEYEYRNGEKISGGVVEPSQSNE